MTKSEDNIPPPMPGDASTLAQSAWVVWDWAGQPYFTLVTTFIYFPYFAANYVGDAVRGQELLGYTLALAGLAVAIVGPVIGAIADAQGRRKPWMAAFSLVFLLSCASLWWADPEVPERAIVIMLMIAVSSFAMECAIVFYNAMLPDLVSDERMGRLSGLGWGMGYLGGLASLALMLWAFSLPGQISSPLIPDRPLWGLDPARFEPERLSAPLSALWYLVFAVPLFLFTSERGTRGLALRDAVRAGITRLAATLVQLRRFGNVALFLLGRMIYNNGLLAIFAFGGVYAAGIFGWDAMRLGLFGIILTVFAALSCFVGGVLDDRLGSKPTLILALVVLAIGTFGIVSVSAEEVLFAVTAPPLDPDRASFASLQEGVYLFFGVVVGLAVGPAQAVSRTFMARLSPPGMATEFFGLYAFSGKATAFAAPAAVAFATALWQSQRAGVLAIALFVLVGLALLLAVREERAQ